MSVLSQLLSFLSQEPPCSPAQPHLRRLYLPVTPTTSEPITCVYYDSRHYVTGTDIIRALVFRFRLEAIPIGSLKKFEEGVFSDLRTLKPGVGAILEAPRSEFLQLLHRFGCIRTQKKQKVFLWKFVDFERLFKEAEKRERKRHADDLAASSSLAAPAAVLGLVGEELKEWKKMQPFWTSTLPLPITVELLPRHNSFFPSPTTSPLPPSPEATTAAAAAVEEEDEMLNKIQQQLWAMMSTSPELVAAAAQALLISSSSSPSSSSSSSVPSLVSSPSLSSAYGMMMESPSPKMMVRSTTGGNRILMQPPTPPHPFSLHQHHGLDEWSDDLLDEPAVVEEEVGITNSLDQFLNDLATVQQASPSPHLSQHHHLSQHKVMDYVAPWWVSETPRSASPSLSSSSANATRRFHPYGR